MSLSELGDSVGVELIAIETEAAAEGGHPVLAGQALARPALLDRNNQLERRAGGRSCLGSPGIWQPPAAPAHRHNPVQEQILLHLLQRMRPVAS